VIDVVYLQVTMRILEILQIWHVRLLYEKSFNICNCIIIIKGIY
jgi:hypothetical protein